MSQKTEYDDLAYVYDWEWKDLTMDLDFLINFSREINDAVLELACGTGRVMIPLAENGLEVYGIDNSEEMLKIGREKIKTLPVDVKSKLHFQYGDMSSFNLNRKFRLVLIPFNSFLLLLKKEEQESCLKCVRSHLTDDGFFVLDIYSPNFKLIAQDTNEMKFLRHFYVPPIEKVVIQWEYLKRDMAEQIAYSDFLYEMYDKHGNLSRRASSLRMKIIFRYEMEYLLEKCGFRIIDLFGDYNKTPYTEESRQMIFVCKKEDN